MSHPGILVSSHLMPDKILSTASHPRQPPPRFGQTLRTRLPAKDSPGTAYRLLQGYRPFKAWPPIGGDKTRPPPSSGSLRLQSQHPGNNGPRTASVSSGAKPLPTISKIKDVCFSNYRDSRIPGFFCPIVGSNLSRTTSKTHSNLWSGGLRKRLGVFYPKALN